MKNFQLYLGLSLVSLLLLISFIGPYLPFVDSNLEKTVVIQQESGKFVVPPFEPGDKFLLGSDREGRDLLSRLIVGAKETLFQMFIIVCLRYIIAIPLGILAFWYKGVILQFLTFLNQLFSRMPTIFITILIINIPFFIFSDVRPFWLILLIALIEVGRAGQIIYDQLESQSHAQYIQSGILVGLSSIALFRKYFFPFLVPQLIVNFVIDLGRTMLLLGQLGLFSIFVSQQWVMDDRMHIELQITTHAWPALLNDIIKDLRKFPWVPFWATFAITYTIVSFNILGEGLRKFYLRKQIR